MKNNRSQNGVSLVELLIATIIMAILSTAVFGVLITTMTSNQKLQNKCDTMDSAKKSIDRITRVVRMGRVVGNASNNQTLIVQVPKFADSGYPYLDTATNTDALETHTYAITGPDANGEYSLTWTKNPGPVVPGSASPSKALMNVAQGPVTLLTGIIGPSTAAQTPPPTPGGLQIFQYIDRTNPAVPQNTPVGTITNYTGVIVNLEIRQHQNSSQDSTGRWRKAGYFAYKTEVFMRNNSNVSQ